MIQSFYQHHKNRFEVLVIALVALIFALIALHPITESDPFWHLSFGRALVDQGSRIVSEPVSLNSFSDPAVVPEWLWSLTTYGLYSIGSWPLLSLFVAFICLLVGATFIGFLFYLLKNERHLSVVVFLLTIIMSLVIARMRLRPQAVFMLLLPLFIWFCFLYRKAKEQKARIIFSIAIVFTTLFWAQLHGSFVLTPILFFISGFSFLKTNSKKRSWDLALFFFIGAACLTSAHGTDILFYIIEHASGDASRHIADIQAPTWQHFFGNGAFYGPIFLLLAGLTLLGMVRVAQIWPRELLLALFGLALGLTAIRFFVAAAILMLPLSVKAISALYQSIHHRLKDGVLWALSLFLLIAVFNHTAKKRGPLLSLGLSAGRYPIAASHYLSKHFKGQEKEAAIFSDVDAGGPLGFWLYGKARVYIDSRIPLYYNDTDYALAREMFNDPIALKIGLRWHRVKAVVTNRRSEMCRNLIKSNWKPTMIGPRYTVFEENSDDPIQSIDACGKSFIKEKNCQTQSAELKKNIQTITKAAEPSFASFLDALYRQRCKGDKKITIPQKERIRRLKKHYQRFKAKHYLMNGRINKAWTILQPLLIKGDSAAYALIGPYLSKKKIPLSNVISTLKESAKQLDDHFPIELRANLAMLCVKTKDVECVRFHGMRAALRGAKSARFPLMWLVRRHPEKRVRKQAFDLLRAFISTQ